MSGPTDINLWQLYYIINSDVVKHYSLRDMFWGLFNSFDEEELEEMGINVKDYDNHIIRECIFEDFSKKVINKIINGHNGCKDRHTIEDWSPKNNVKEKN